MIKWIKRILITIISLIFIVILGFWIKFYFWKQDVIESMPYDSIVAETQNGPIEYTLTGNSDKYMLIVHGTPGSAYIADSKMFTENGFSVLAISRPGYYKTPLTSGQTPAEQAEMYKLLLDKLEIDSVYINAVSGGGPSSVLFAVEYPERTAGVILRAAVTDQIDANSDERNLAEKFFQTEFGMWLGIQMMLFQADEETEEMIKLFAKKGIYPMSETNTGIQNDYSQFSKIENLHLSKITEPTIIFHGNKDEIVPLSFSQNAASEIPNSKLIVMEGKDHFVFRTPYADTINMKIINFVDALK